MLLDGDHVTIVRRDGTAEPLLASGRPGGICAHSTATATARARP